VHKQATFFQKRRFKKIETRSSQNVKVATSTSSPLSKKSLLALRKALSRHEEVPIDLQERGRIFQRGNQGSEYKDWNVPRHQMYEEFLQKCRSGEFLDSALLDIFNNDGIPVPYTLTLFPRSQVNNLREIQAIKRLTPHPHIVKMDEVLFDPPTGRLALVFELLEGNLYELMKGESC
jgi:hypothetical protein